MFVNLLPHYKTTQISESDVMTASDGEPFLHHIARSGIIKPLLMMAFRGQSNLKWKGRVPSELGISKYHKY